jgi:hypothetical protein
MTTSPLRTPEGVPPAEAAGSLRIGQVYLDVPGRRLLLLNAAARQFRDEGVPFLGTEPGLPDLRTLAGQPVRAEDLPLAVAAREGHPVEADFVLRRPGQPTWHLLCCATPLTDPAGQVASVLGTVCCGPPPPDWQTLAGLAHDLRTPLQNLSVLLTLMDGKRPGEQEESLDLLRSSAARVQEVAADLLDWCHLPGQGGRRVACAWLPLEPFLLKLVAEMGAAAGLKSLYLGTALKEAQGWQIYSDRVRLGRVVMNLLSNAIRYTPRGGRVTLHAAWRGEGRERLLVLGVTDTGVGIAPDEQECIFQAGERGRAGREGDSSGSGLGLAVVDRLAAELGLRRELVSEHGRGSVFRALVPQRLLRFAPPLLPGP